MDYVNFVLQRGVSVSLACLATLSQVACGGGGSAGQGAAVQTDPLVSTPQLAQLTQTTRTACPAYASFDFNAQGIECHETSVPEDYAQPTGPRLKLLTMVRRTQASQAKGTLVFLDGGPGGNGLGFLRQSAQQKILSDEGWDIVVPGHRGTHSSLLQCKQATAARQTLSSELSPCTFSFSGPSLQCQALQAQAEHCVQELIDQHGGGEQGAQRLSQYHSAHAARDVAALLPAVSRTARKAVLGVSYGTYWAQRLGQLHPTSVDQVILDSSVALGASVEEAALHAQDMLVEVLDACTRDSGCRERLRFASGREALDAAMQRFNTGRCGWESLPSGAGTPWAASQYEVALNLALASVEARPLLPYLVRLAVECRGYEMRDALLAALRRYSSPGTSSGDASPLPATAAPQEASTNLALYQVVKYTELFNAADRNAMSKVTQLAQTVAQRALGSIALSEYRSLETSVRKLVFNPLARSYSQFVPEVLLLQARIDPATPRQFSEAVVSELQQAGVRPQVYTMEHASHSTLRTSTVVDARSGMTCGLQRMLHFLQRRSAEAFACQEASTDWDFSTPESQARARELIGRDQPWSGAALQGAS
jgi:pimeloyl-ACP methyl ester carboxylesterase